MTPHSIDPPEPVDGESIVGGVLLAAGTSDRFGDRNKLLAEIEGIPIVRRTATNLLASRIDAVVVVLGYEAERVREVLEGIDRDDVGTVGFVENPDYPDGLASSVRVGIREIRGRVDAAMIVLGDMPFVKSSSIDALIDAYRAGCGDVLAAAYNGKRGNPVLFDKRFFDGLEDTTGDKGGRAILREKGALIESNDPGVCIDIDRQCDLHRRPSEGRPSDQNRD